MDDQEIGDPPSVVEFVCNPLSAGKGEAERRHEAASKPAAVQGNGQEKKKRKRRRKRRRSPFVRDPATLAWQSTKMNNSGQPEAASETAKQPADDQAAPKHRAYEKEAQLRRQIAYATRANFGEQNEKVYAALDLGTNNCRLLVAVPGRPGRFRVVDAFSRIVRLGEGLSASGRLSEAAMERAVAALSICAKKLSGRQLSGVRMIATEACRSAENGHFFLERVYEETGLRLEVIDRQTEARLAVSGCSSLVTRDAQGVVLFDIGGGSSEIALVDLSSRRSRRISDNIVSWTSLPIGVVTLAEHYGGRNVTQQTFEAMVAEVSALLSRFDNVGRLAHVTSSNRFHLLGTSGTVTTLAGVHLGLKRYDRKRVDGLWMDRRSVDQMIETILGWSFDERKANPCIGSERADLVLAGCAILEAIRRQWPAEHLRVADRGLREGMLNEMMSRDGVWRRRKRAGAFLS